MDALEFFLLHHQRVHAQIETNFLDDLTEEQMRRRPYQGSNSIASLVWHLARCEDMMSLVITGRRQVLGQGDWLSRLNLARRDIGTGMSDEEVGDFTNQVDIPTLAGYYRAVGQKTREVVTILRPENLDEVPDPENLRRALLAEGAIGEDLVSWIVGEREGNPKGWSGVHDARAPGNGPVFHLHRHLAGSGALGDPGEDAGEAHVVPGHYAIHHPGRCAGFLCLWDRRLAHIPDDRPCLGNQYFRQYFRAVSRGSRGSPGGPLFQLPGASVLSGANDQSQHHDDAVPHGQVPGGLH